MKLMKFLPNRVWRVYKGGACIDALRSAAEPVDASFPEEWIASTVEAINPQHPIEGAGLSRVDLGNGESVTLQELIEKDGENLLGAEHIARVGRTTGFLTKLLDSAIRLPVQAHPDREASRRLFNSSYGKTEAWIVLGGRTIDGEEACLYMGFNDRFDWEVFCEEAKSGVMERSLEMMHRYPIVPGEVIMIPGGFPHAIGPGCLVQEIMEPSDWVVQPENKCGEQPLTLQDRFCGLEADAAMEVFHHEILTMDELRKKVLIQPEKLSQDAGATVTRLIDREKIGFFGALKVELNSRWKRPEEMSCFMAGTVLSGSLNICDGDEEIALTQGDTFALAANAAPVFSGNAVVLLALPPVR